MPFRGIWQDGNVRPNAFVFLRRDGDGNLSGMEGSRLEQGEDIVAMNAAMAAITERSLGTPGKGELQRALCNQERDGG